MGQLWSSSNDKPKAPEHATATSSKASDRVVAAVDPHVVLFNTLERIIGPQTDSRFPLEVLKIVHQYAETRPFYCSRSKQVVSLQLTFGRAAIQPVLELPDRILHICECDRVVYILDEKSSISVIDTNQNVRSLPIPTTLKRHLSMCSDGSSIFCSGVPIRNVFGIGHEPHSWFSYHPVCRTYLYSPPY